MKQHTRDRFPITVKKGHATVKIYEVKNRDRANYCVSYIGATGRQRRNFADLDLAKREAANTAQNLADGDLEALKLTGREKQIYVEAERAIAASGLPLHSVAHEFARAFDILGGAHIAEAARYYKEADVFLFPTLSDGFGLTQLEAQAWKLPAIVSRFCGEVFRDGVNGIVLHEVSGKAVSDAVRWLIAEPSRLGFMSRNSIGSTEFGLERFASRLLELAA